MKNYLAGCDILGADWGVPVVMNEADIGIPSFVDDVTGDVVEDTEAVVANRIRRMEKELSDEFERIFEPEENVGHGGGGGGHGGGGHGGGHGGHGHGGRGWGGRGWGGYGWGGGYPYYADTVDCEYDQFGRCIPVTPILVVGAFDFNVEQKKMYQLKVVPVSVAQALLQGGQAAIDGAIQGAKQPWYKADLPGDNSRANVKGKLQWHANALAPLANTPNAIYASGPDLQHWVLMAFRESNAVEAGAVYIDAAWKQMWTDIAVALKALPAEIRKAVGDIVQLTTGLPVWGWALAATGVLVVLGGAIYAALNSKAGAAVAGVAAKTYMR